MFKARYYLLDVFTGKRFGGNQLAIFPDAHHIEDSLYPSIAREMNLSETVFLFPKREDGAHPMRIFTPTSELPTAGHPTIGTAFYLARDTRLEKGDFELQLEQQVGTIPVSVKVKNNVPVFATMQQPLPDFGKVFENRSQIAELLGLQPDDLMPHPIQRISCGVPYLLVPITSLKAIQSITFRLDVWEKLKARIDAFVYAFTLETELRRSDVHGRMFAPEAGILEDPATGSANGPLGCYLIHHLALRPPFQSEQGFELGRPSLLRISPEQDAEQTITAVKVGGEAVFVGQGELFLD